MRQHSNSPSQLLMKKEDTPATYVCASDLEKLDLDIDSGAQW